MKTRAHFKTFGFEPTFLNWSGMQKGFATSCKLFLLSIAFMGAFIFFSYTVAKDRWQQIDFDTTVKLQDKISSGFNPEQTQRIDGLFSYFSILGSVEVMLGFCLIAAGWSFFKGRWLAILGWLIMVPALVVEIFGKLVLFHPGPPVFFHRSLLPTGLPSFYVYTNFSYPSGHMMRTIFIATVLACLIIFSPRNSLSKLIVLLVLAGSAFIMGLTRVYLGEHWVSDVIGGGLLGLSAGLFGSVLILREKKV